jgi:predicted O-methyltransferase YrrM
MVLEQVNHIESTLSQLFKDSKNDSLKIMKGLAKSILRPIQPADFEGAYLSISKEQGEDLVRLIIENNLKNIVEFGTSFGISTLYLAQGVIKTNGKIITTELLSSKANKAIENFKMAGVENLIEVRIGDAMETLKTYSEPIDLLLLDGWKDLYSPLFQMLEPNFHTETIIYVDNAEMAEAKGFLNSVSLIKRYRYNQNLATKWF